MDEVENPALPAAGEASPTLRPIEEDEDSGAAMRGPSNLPLDTIAAEEAALENNRDNIVSSQLLPPRPPLKREPPAAPPSQPPPAPPPNTSDVPQDAPDSLTLADLKRMRNTFPTVQPVQKQQLQDYGTVYDFQYADAQSLPVEIEEWFSYSEDEKERLRRCKNAFHDEWTASEEGKKTSWLDVTEDVRRSFISKKVDSLWNSYHQDGATGALMILTYLTLGAWQETAGKQQGSGDLDDLFSDGKIPGSRLGDYATSSLQIQWIVSMVDTLHACDALPAIYATLRHQSEIDFRVGFAVEDFDMTSGSYQPRRPPQESLEMWCCLTLLYLFIEVARATSGDQGEKLRKPIVSLEPTLLSYFNQIIDKLRWEEHLPIPLTKMLLISWKTILVTLGSLKDLENVKASLRSAEQLQQDSETDVRGEPVITASPLDYHLFRQEISSKYPAFQPPAPLFPLEPDSNTILPPLKRRQPSFAITDAAFKGAPAVSTDSLMHTPVHIATPAPSPPPSPAGPGKAGKKQNYQTNQMFPFLYPPLDSTSNDLGGKGTTELQDALVGKKWEGGDIPTSILEAADLFAKRMRATRAMRQLWKVRVDFMKQERGWKREEKPKVEEAVPNEKVDGMMTLDDLKDLEGLEDLKLDDISDDDDENEEEINDIQGPEKEDDQADQAPQTAPEDEFEVIEPPEPEETAEQGEPLHQTDSQRRLDAVDAYYRACLPHLQSLVIVVTRALMVNVSDVAAKTGANGGLQAGITFPSENPNGLLNGMGSAKPVENGGNNINGVSGIDGAGTGIESTAEEVGNLRNMEIQGKASSAIVLMLLKWFKASHILQYEFFSQLLLDSNFVPVALKLWQVEDVGRACHFKVEKTEKEFFYWCREDSGRLAKAEKEKVAADSEKEKEKKEEDGDEAVESEDEALPPPIKLKRDTPEGQAEEVENNLLSPTEFSHPPEVDELGYPATPLPASPIKNYSWRNMFSHINYLRILQKITRRKTHRSLMLVQYKSSNHLKKTLRTPVYLLRYYTLKLFKSQVPFCGRKWRQSNMKIITAVWLSVPAELRDDWLSGGGGGMGGACVGDVDGSVEDSVPLEQSLRALTHWWNVREFPDAMGWVKAMGEGEVGFFERELGLMESDGERKEGPEYTEEELMRMGADVNYPLGGGWTGPIEGF